jgi:transcriptional regulator with XRE-family HTH domain
MRELGDRLRGFRLEKGWSKRAVAQLLGVSTPSIMRWEDGSAEPNDYNRHKIERLISSESSGIPSSSDPRASHYNVRSQVSRQNGAR